MRPIERIRSVYRRYTGYSKIFSSLVEARQYELMKRNRREHALRGGAFPPVGLRLKAIGGRRVLCRPGTTDPMVLWDTFARGVQPVPVPLRGSSTIVDLGANVGYTAALYAYLYPSARIVMVEMNRENLDLARHNTEFFAARRHLVHAAAWSHDGEVSYGGTEEWAYRVSEIDDALCSGETAPARALDSIFDECGLETVDFVKMDVEGAEAAILDGPMGWADRVRSMRIELHPPATWERCSEALRTRGFICTLQEMDVSYLVAVRAESDRSPSAALRNATMQDCP